MSMIDQICFTNEANCVEFKGHCLKANMCINCMKDISKHNKLYVKEEDLIKALEQTQKGEKIPSLILDEENGNGKLYLGGFKAAINTEFIQAKNVTAILNTVGSGLFKLFGRKFKESYTLAVNSNDVSCLYMDWEDAITYDISDDDLEKAIKFIHEHRLNGGAVLVHCAQGKSRSTTAVVAYLMALLNYDVQKALKYTQERRKMAEPNSHFMYLLHEFEKGDLLKRLREQLHDKATSITS